MNNEAAITRCPGYDVLAKRDTPLSDPVTRKLVDERLATPQHPRFFNEAQWSAVAALCHCVVAQSAEREPVPVAAMLDARPRKRLHAMDLPWSTSEVVAPCFDRPDSLAPP